jgi:hypothetical protein
MKYQMRLMAPDPDTILGDDAVNGIVGQQMPFKVEGAVLPEGAKPTATITRAWVDDDGWLCAEVEVDYGHDALDRDDGPFSIG